MARSCLHLYMLGAEEQAAQAWYAGMFGGRPRTRVTGLEAFCRRLEAEGVTFDVPYARTSSGIGHAFLTDRRSVYIELSERLRGS